MPDEWLDLVSPEDEVIGRERRSAIHRLGLKHRAVHILVFNRQGDLFLQKRSRTKDSSPGLWDSSASGHVDAGEDYDRCALRELKEELNLEPGTPPVRLFKIDACPATGEEFVWVYRCQAEGPFQLHPEEIECGRWFTLMELDTALRERPQDFTTTVPLIWQRLPVGPD